MKALFPFLAAFALLMSIAAAAHGGLKGDDVVWESVACVLDHAGGVPYAWGISSALRGAPAALGGGDGTAGGQAAGVLGRSAAASVVPSVARWLARAVADAFFVPVDECAGLLGMLVGAESYSPPAGAAAGAEAAVGCARGWSFFYFIFIDRFEAGMVVDDAVGALMSVGLMADGGFRRLPLHLIKIVVALSCPKGGAAGYFVDIQYEAAWDWLLAAGTHYVDHAWGERELEAGSL